MASCTGKQNSSLGSTDQTEDSLYSDSYNSGTIDDISDNKDKTDSECREYLAEAIRCIANNDAKGFASHCIYPIKRRRPLHDIADSASMVKYFDILFDKDFRKKLKNKSAKDWDALGERGYLFDYGLFWDQGYLGGITNINYISPQENQLWRKKIDEDINSLHPSVQGNWILSYTFVCDNGTIVRIESEDKENPETYRMLLYFKGTPIKAKPDVCMTGSLEIQGSMHNEYYTFTGKDGSSAELYYAPMLGDDGEPELTLKGKKSFTTTKLTSVYWDEIL